MMEQLVNRSDTDIKNKSLGGLLYTTVQYIPLLSTLVGIGFLLIYILARLGLLGDPAWQLLAVTGIVLLLTVSHLLIINLARKERGLAAYLLYLVAMAAASVLFVIFWQGIFLVALLIAWIVPLTLIAARTNRLYIVSAVIFSTITTGFIVWLDGYPFIERLSNNNPAGFTALILLASTVILFI